jgi:copper chaperone
MVTFRVPDMTCGRCASTIARAVFAVDNVARVEVSVLDRLVSITSTEAEAELLEAIQEAGYSPERVVGTLAASNSSSGCCCAPRKSAAVDAGQPGTGAGGSCCS